MICTDCRGVPVTLLPPPLSRLVVANHTACRGGTWCDCQHKPKRPVPGTGTRPTLGK